MTRLQLTSQSQTLTDSGWSTDTLIYNEGPDTIFLDEIAGVSSSLSMPVPPLASVIWRAAVKCFGVSRGLSNVRVIRTNGNPVANTISRQSVLVRKSTFTASTSQAFHDLTECSNYQALRYAFKNTAAFVFLNAYVINVDWYDSEQNYLSTDTYLPGMAVANKNVAFTVPVKGSFFKTWVDSSFAGELSDLFIIGLTDNPGMILEPSYSQDAGSPDTERNCPIIGASGITLDGKTWSEDWASFTYNSTIGDVAFHAKSKLITVVFRFATAPTVAGTFSVNPIKGNISLKDTQSIVAGTNIQAFDFYVPNSASCYIDIKTAPTAVSPPTVQLLWRD